MWEIRGGRIEGDGGGGGRGLVPSPIAPHAGLRVPGAPVPLGTPYPAGNSGTGTSLSFRFAMFLGIYFGVSMVWPSRSLADNGDACRRGAGAGAGGGVGATSAAISCI